MSVKSSRTGECVQERRAARDESVWPVPAERSGLETGGRLLSGGTRVRKFTLRRSSGGREPLGAGQAGGPRRRPQ